MKKLLVLAALALCLATARAGNYQNFDVAVYITVGDALLEQVKKFFVERGVKVAGGSAFSDQSAGQFKSFCYTDPADRDFVKKVSELAARHFWALTRA